MLDNAVPINNQPHSQCLLVKIVSWKFWRSFKLALESGSSRFENIRVSPGEPCLLDKLDKLSSKVWKMNEGCSCKIEEMCGTFFCIGMLKIYHVARTAYFSRSCPVRSVCSSRAILCSVGSSLSYHIPQSFFAVRSPFLTCCRYSRKYTDICVNS